MAVVIQKVVGKERNNHHYPDFSGTAASYNYYPFGDYMKPEDRIAHLALGLGKTIVEGESSIRFCPKYPKLNFYSTPDMLLDHSQKNYYAIDLTKTEFDILDEDPYVKRLDLGDAIKEGTLTKIADTYDFESEILKDGYFGEGSPIITFSQQLKLEKTPLATLITRILAIGEKALGSSIEIEFAGDFADSKQKRDQFYILQIRPFLQQEALLVENVEIIDVDQILAFSSHVSGNLLRKDIKDIVYVKAEKFDKTKTLEIVDEIDSINSVLIKNNRPYLLIGFGRWGTADRFLGIPAKWSNINGAKTIIETSLENFSVDFSQGTHFFHNIVTANIGYFYIKHNSESHKLDWNWIRKQKPVTDLEYVSHIRLQDPLTVRIDAHKREGMILKPEY